MARITFLLVGDKYASVEADAMFEENGYLRAFNTKYELVAMFKTDVVMAAYLTEARKDNKNESA